jgi:hypothetical protein
MVGSTLNAIARGALAENTCQSSRVRAANGCARIANAVVIAAHLAATFMAFYIIRTVAAWPHFTNKGVGQFADDLCGRPLIRKGHKVIQS